MTEASKIKRRLRERKRRKERYHSDPLYRAKVLARCKQRQSTEAWRKLHRVVSKRYYDNPKNILRIREYRKQHNAKPETQALKKSLRIKYRNRPEIKARRRLYQLIWRRSVHGKAKSLSYEAKRRLSIESAFSVDSVIAIRRIKESARVRCFHCSKPVSSQNVQIDHLLPLAKDGAHSAYNLVPSCAECNRKKTDKHPNEFVKSQTLLVFK
jgi:5-methylcytosine-specific restriction endonuclease McrA